MSRETANAARVNKGMMVLTYLEGELLDALEDLRSMYPNDEDMLKMNPNGIMRGFSAAAVNYCKKSNEAIKSAHGE